MQFRSRYYFFYLWEMDPVQFEKLCENYFIHANLQNISEEEKSKKRQELFSLVIRIQTEPEYQRQVNKLLKHIHDERKNSEKHSSNNSNANSSRGSSK